MESRWAWIPAWIMGLASASTVVHNSCTYAYEESSCRLRERKDGDGFFTWVCEARGTLLNQTDTLPNRTTTILNRTDTQLNLTDTLLNRTTTLLNRTDTQLNLTDTQLNLTDTQLNRTDTLLNRTTTLLNRTDTQLNLTDTQLNRTDTLLNRTDTLPNRTDCANAAMKADVRCVGSPAGCQPYPRVATRAPATLAPKVYVRVPLVDHSDSWLDVLGIVVGCVLLVILVTCLSLRRAKPGRREDSPVAESELRVFVEVAEAPPVEEKVGERSGADAGTAAGISATSAATAGTQESATVTEDKDRGATTEDKDHGHGGTTED